MTVAVAELVAAIAAYGENEPPQMKLVTSLAEGADQLFAKAALQRLWPMVCVTPFSLAEFERDFGPPAALGPNALSDLRDLLHHARCGPGLELVELPGERDDEASAYAAAAREVVDRCELLLAIWDGGPAGGPGGTADTIAYAQSQGRPVLVLDPGDAARWTLLKPAMSSVSAPARAGAALAALVGQSLADVGGKAALAPCLSCVEHEAEL